jgi:hypothetical protein
VVQDEEQETLTPGLFLDEPEPNQWSGLEIEGPSGLPDGRGLSLPVADLEHLDGQLDPRTDDLEDGVSLGSKRRPEQAMPGDDLVEGPLQSANV